MSSKFAMKNVQQMYAQQDGHLIRPPKKNGPLLLRAGHAAGAWRQNHGQNVSLWGPWVILSVR